MDIDKIKKALTKNDVRKQIYYNKSLHTTYYLLCLQSFKPEIIHK